MLHVSARIDRRFELPVRLALAEAHFRDFRQTLPDLPELDLTAELGPGQYRVRYRGDVCTAAAPCDDVFLYWSAFDCDTPALADATTALLAARVLSWRRTSRR